MITRPWVVLLVLAGLSCAACSTPAPVDGGAGGGAGGGTAGGAGGGGGAGDGGLICPPILDAGAPPPLQLEVIAGPPGSGDLRSVFVDPYGPDVYIAGDGNRLFRYAAGAWTAVPTPFPPATRLTAVGRAMGGALVVLGEEALGDGGTLYDGRSLDVAAGTWSPLPASAVAAGFSPRLLSRRTGAIASTDGSQWQLTGGAPWALIATFAEAPTALDGTPNGTWVAIDGGVVQPGSGRSTPPLPSGCRRPAALTLVDDAAGLRVFVVGGGHFCGSAFNGAWTDAAAGVSLNDVVIFLAFQALAVGDDGAVVVQSQSGELTPVCPATTEQLLSVAAGFNEWWMVGRNNTVLRGHR